MKQHDDVYSIIKYIFKIFCKLTKIFLPPNHLKAVITQTFVMCYNIWNFSSLPDTQNVGNLFFET